MESLVELQGFFFFCGAGMQIALLYPNVDTSSQVTNEQVTRENGQLRVSFTIPCRSTDTRDVPYEGLHYLLFATGAVVGDDITYHDNTRWHTDGPLQLTCGGGYWREFLLWNIFLYCHRDDDELSDGCVHACVCCYLHPCLHTPDIFSKILATQFSSSTEVLPFLDNSNMRACRRKVQARMIIFKTWKILQNVFFLENSKLCTKLFELHKSEETRKICCWRFHAQQLSAGSKLFSLYTCNSFWNSLKGSYLPVNCMNNMKVDVNKPE